MKALDLYRMVLENLDSFGRPAFDPRNFNYWFPEAMSQYIKENTPTFDTDIKTLGDLQVLLVPAETLDLVNGEVALPAAYHTLWRCKSFVSFTRNFRRYKKDQSYWVPTRKYVADKAGFNEDNAFKEARLDRPYYQIAAKKVRIHAGTGLGTVTKVELEYLRQPARVYLSPDIVNNPEAENTECEFAEHLCREIVHICVRLFNEAIQANRYGTNLQEKALRKE